MRFLANGMLVLSIVLAVGLCSTASWAALGDVQVTGAPAGSVTPGSTFTLTYSVDVGTESVKLVATRLRVIVDGTMAELAGMELAGGMMPDINSWSANSVNPPVFPVQPNAQSRIGLLGSSQSTPVGSGLRKLAALQFRVKPGATGSVSVQIEFLDPLALVNASSDARDVAVTNPSATMVTIGEAEPITISGRITRNGAGESGVTVTPTLGAAVTTNANGDYTLTVSNRFTGTVTPSKSGVSSFDPVNRSYTGITSNQTGQNYTVPVSCNISLSADQLVDAAAGTVQFTVTSTGAWSVSDNQNWASVSPSSGIGNGSVTISYVANSGASERSATLTVTRTDCSGGSDTAVLRQSGIIKRTLSIVKGGDGAGQVRVNGTLQSLPFSAEFDEGATVNLEAVPASGSNFTGWSGDASGSAILTTVLMSRDSAVTASFKTGEERYTIVVDADPSTGSVTLSPPQPAEGYLKGAKVTATGTPEAGHTFFSWGYSFNFSPTNPITIVVDKDIVLTPLFYSCSFMNWGDADGTTLVGASAGSLEMELEMAVGTCSWAIEGNADWVRVSPRSGTGPATVSFAWDENIGESSRQAVFTASFNGLAPATYTIVQDGVSSGCGCSGSVKNFNDFIKYHLGDLSVLVSAMATLLILSRLRQE